MPETAVSHPARFSDAILAVLRDVLTQEMEGRGSLRVLDPMAGTGAVHTLATVDISTEGIELEPEWAAAHEWTKQGDATALPYDSETFDACVTSPSYGNRMADHHDAKDDSRRIGYRFALGRPLTPGSGAGMQWGSDYRSLHLRILREMERVTKPGGLVVVNVSNHVRAHAEVYVAEWWLANMLALGLKFEQAIPVATPRMRFGQNNQARVQNEWVWVCRKRP
jgi:tRNA G10  N-methylase Trm11